MAQVQTACKNIQINTRRRMVTPTSSDLTFDFTMGQESICFGCNYRDCCRVSGLLNVPVKSCTFFEEQLMVAAN